MVDFGLRILCIEMFVIVLIVVFVLNEKSIIVELD